MKLSEQYAQEAGDLEREASHLDEDTYEHIEELSDSAITHRQMKADWMRTLADNRRRDAEYFEERGY